MRREGTFLWYLEVGRLFDVRPRGGVFTAEFVSKNDRVSHFVELQAAENRRSVELGILGEGAIGLLLDFKEVVQGAARAGQVPVGD